MITSGKIYLQVYENNSFKELGFNNNTTSGIYIAHTTGLGYSRGDRKDFYPYTGLSIPRFNTEEIITYPIFIGTSIYGGAIKTPVGAQIPRIEIGLDNFAVGFESERPKGSPGEVAIGEGNVLFRTVGCASVGALNEYRKGKYGFAYGYSNINYFTAGSYVLGELNYVSGIYNSTVLGKSNTITSKSPDLEFVFSGQPSLKSNLVTVVGDLNQIQSGAINVTTLGNFNYTFESIDTLNLGSYNFSNRCTGYNAFIGYRNNGIESNGTICIGRDNLSRKDRKSYIVGNDNTLGSINPVSNRYNNTFYGSYNILEDGTVNNVVGNSNFIKSDFENIFGSNNKSSNSASNIIYGTYNDISGAEENLYFGVDNTTFHGVLGDIFGVNLINGLVAYGAPYSGYDRDTLSVHNSFFGSHNKSFAISNSNIFGDNNKLVDSTGPVIVGKNNIVVNDENSSIVGRDNTISGCTGVYVVGANNNIFSQTGSIFVGFNFAGSGLQRVGMKISYSGIELFGTVKRNGVII